jgi:hypothetical protein
MGCFQGHLGLAQLIILHLQFNLVHLQFVQQVRYCRRVKLFGLQAPGLQQFLGFAA